MDAVAAAVRFHAPTCKVRCDLQRAGYTLIEMLVSLTAASMLLVGMASAIVVTANAISPPAEQSAILAAAETSFIISDELQSAIHVLEHSSIATKFAVADRDADGSTEIVRYVWDSEQQIVDRHFNSSVGALETSLQSFSLTPEFRSISEELGGVVSESNPNTLEGMVSATNRYSHSLSSTTLAGQALEVTHPEGTTVWSIDTVSLLLKRSSYYQSGEVVWIQIRGATGDGLPTGTVFGEASVPLSSLTTSYAVRTVSISGADRLMTSQPVCIVVTADQEINGVSGRVAYATDSFTNHGRMLKTIANEHDWHIFSNKSLYYKVTGTRFTLDESTHEVTRMYFAGYHISLQHTDSATTVDRRIRLMNTPENLSEILRLDFNEEPTGEIDVNYDGIDDWVTSAGSLTESTHYSTWTFADGELIRTQADDDFANLITVEVACRGAVAAFGGGGAIVEVPFGADDNASGMLKITCEQDETGAQTATVSAADGADGQTIALVRQLPNEMVDFRVVIDPDHNQAAVWVNGVFQGRSVVQQPILTTNKTVWLGAEGADAEFDFVSIRVGGAE